MTHHLNSWVRISVSFFYFLLILFSSTGNLYAKEHKQNDNAEITGLFVSQKDYGTLLTRSPDFKQAFENSSPEVQDHILNTIETSGNEEFHPMDEQCQTGDEQCSSEEPCHPGAGPLTRAAFCSMASAVCLGGAIGGAGAVIPAAMFATSSVLAHEAVNYLSETYLPENLAKAVKKSSLAVNLMVSYAWTGEFFKTMGSVFGSYIGHDMASAAAEQVVPDIPGATLVKLSLSTLGAYAGACTGAACGQIVANEASRTTVNSACPSDSTTTNACASVFRVDESYLPPTTTIEEVQGHLDSEFLQSSIIPAINYNNDYIITRGSQGCEWGDLKCCMSKCRVTTGRGEAFYSSGSIEELSRAYTACCSEPPATDNNSIGNASNITGSDAGNNIAVVAGVVVPGSIVVGVAGTVILVPAAYYVKRLRSKLDSEAQAKQVNTRQSWSKWIKFKMLGL